jgi:hypothetical protein
MAMKAAHFLKGFLLLTMALAAALLASSARAQPQRIYVPQMAEKPQYKPSGIGFSADSGNVWGIQRWLSYGGQTADAIATTSTNDCTPTCAEGHVVSATTHIRFSGNTYCGGRTAYAWFEVIASSNKAVAHVGELQNLESLCPDYHFVPEDSTAMWFSSPSGNIQCEVSSGKPLGVYAYCQTFQPERSVTMHADGRSSVCSGGCAGNGPTDAFVLAYGTSERLGPFVCTSQTTGVRCVVSGTGRGFQISRQNIKRF